MGPKLLVITLLVVLVAIGTEAQRERNRERGERRQRRPERPGRGEQRGSGRPGGRRWTGQQFTWTRDLGNGETATERAYAPADKQVLFQRSSGPALRTHGVTKSVTLYDYSGDQPIMVISVRGRRRRGPCLLTDSSFASYQDVLTVSQARNGTTVSVTDQRRLDGTAEQMSPSDTQVLLQTSTSTRRICRRGVIVRLRPDGSNPAPATPTEEVKILTLDGELIITMPAVADTGRGRGGRRGGADRPEGGRRGGNRRGERRSRGRGGRRGGGETDVLVGTGEDV